MDKRTLLAATLSLALAGAPVVSTAGAATHQPDPIAHVALGAAKRHHHQTYVDPFGYVNPFGHGHGKPGNHYVNPFGNGHAYGRLCATESKHHVRGEKGTPFSNCVKALAQAAKKSHEKPAAACRTESRHHVKGQKGTPFSRCVAAVKKLRHGA